MNEHFIIWTEDKREGTDEPRKVILEFDDPHILEDAVRDAIFKGELFLMNSIRNYVKGLNFKINLYFGVDDFEKEFGSRTVYHLSFVPFPRSYVRASVDENKVDDERFVNDVHYVWNRMFDLGFLKKNNRPLSDQVVHDGLYWVSGFDNPQNLISYPQKYNSHVFGTLLMLEALVDTASRYGFERIR